MGKILFVCTGNTCRSPMAAALMNKLLRQRGAQDVVAESAGLAAVAGAPASVNAVLAAEEAGADLKSHRARQVTAEMVDESSVVYALSPDHRAALRRAFPHSAGKIRLLGGGIADPFGGDLAVYRRCRDEIFAALKEVVEERAKP